MARPENNPSDPLSGAGTTQIAVAPKRRGRGRTPDRTAPERVSFEVQRDEIRAIIRKAVSWLAS